MPPVADPKSVDSRLEAMLDAYRQSAGTSDELIQTDGTVRPVWLSFLRILAGMSREELARRTAVGDQYLRDAGVYFRSYGAPNTEVRDWPLSHIPVLIDEQEWAGISTGLKQRADLLEQVVADLYGDNQLAAKGYLTARLLAENPQWLRPLVGVKPAGGHYLHFLAFEIGRGPLGQWWVLGDRTQAPSGAGFALENRIASSRIFHGHYANANVHRLAGFFSVFRDSLMAMRKSDGDRVAILTSGPHTDTYFEHAFISRYLGLTLLQGEDLVVRDNELMVRTVGGFHPVSVLWRRIDAEWVDPLELKQGSTLGTAGFLGAVRSGRVALVNALGTGILETRALLAFLPRICELLTGQPLLLPNIATWWCGQHAERSQVLSRHREMLVGDAFSTALPFDRDSIAFMGGVATTGTGPDFEQLLAQDADRLVGQQAVSLSTTPMLVNGELVPRPMTLRVFLARTSEGWTVMPGGFARIGGSGDSSALSMQSGGSVADTWIVAKHPVVTPSLVPTISTAQRQARVGALPGRAASDLFWLGRYVERFEHMIRVLRAYHVRLAESTTEGSPSILLARKYLKMIGVEESPRLPPDVLARLRQASATASHVRDRFSVDGWNALMDLDKTVSAMMKTARAGDDMVSAMSVLLRKISGFSGLIHENMYRFTGWRFLSLGRSLERAMGTSAIVLHFADSDASEGGLEFALEVGDSVMTHRRRYAVSTNRATITDLLVLDLLNPRSVIYQLDDMEEHLSFLPGAESHRQLSPLQRQLLKARTALAVETPESLSHDMLVAVSAQIAAVTDSINTTYFG